MPRLLGVDIPNDRPASVSLTYLYGVGPKTSRQLCHKAGVDPNQRARDLAEDEEDLRAFAERAGERTVSFDKVVKDLKARGKI